MTNAMKKLTDYFHGAVSELKKVVWPTREQAVNYSILVIAISISLAVFFALLDYIFNGILTAVI